MSETAACQTNGVGKRSTTHLNLTVSMKAQWEAEFELYLSVLKPEEAKGIRAQAAIIKKQQSRRLWESV